MAVSAATSRQTELIKKKICKVFENNSLEVTIEANLKVVNFLDITMDLNTGLFKPFMKDNDIPLYVNKSSNHPPTVLKSIPNGVGRRLSRISSNKDVFDAAVPQYQEALDRSGYKEKLTFEPQILGTKKKNRSRKSTWFNPPFSASVKTNVGREFLRLIDRAFPPNNPLHKLFTRQTVKVSYKCMPSMAQAVSQHNMSVLHDDQLAVQQPGCNCRGGPGSCPVRAG